MIHSPDIVDDVARVHETLDRAQATGAAAMFDARQLLKRAMHEIGQLRARLHAFEQADLDKRNKLQARRDAAAVKKTAKLEAIYQRKKAAKNAAAERARQKATAMENAPKE